MWYQLEDCESFYEEGEGEIPTNAKLRQTSVQGKRKIKTELCVTVIFLWTTFLSTTFSEENQKVRHSSHYITASSGVRWDVWTPWSECSVDCGIGITQRSRECRSMEDGQVTDGCHGLNKELKVCEITGCIREVTRECKKLETRMYGGKRYRWQPYTHPVHVCEKACKPFSAGFYLGLGKNVSDGTPCNDDATRVCIQGQCKSIGCDGVVDSDAVPDSCGVCGGDGTSCKSVSKTFTKDVKFGYQTIATIPRGATNIVITEVEAVRNYLALKSVDGSFSLNINFRLSRFGEHPGAGTVFMYNRGSGPDCPDECIKADGPTDIELEIMLLVYSDNKGVRYSYSVPMDTVTYTEIGDEGGISPMVHIGGGSIPGKNNEVDITNNKRPIFSYDFKFKKHKKHAHKHHKHHNKPKEYDVKVDRERVITVIAKDDKLHATSDIDNDNASELDDVTGETGALSEGETANRKQGTNVGDTDDINSEHETNTNVDFPETDDGINDDEQEPASYTAADNVGNDDTDEATVDTTSDTQNETSDTYIEIEEVEPDDNHPGIAEDDFGGGVYLNRNSTADNDTDAAELDVTEDEDIAERVTGVDPDEVDMYNNDNRIPSLYSWREAGYTTCSQTCGEGKQSAILECIVTDKRAQVQDTFCAELTKPSLGVLVCNYGPCPASWQPRPWSKCSVTCDIGTQVREYVCTNADGVEVNNNECGYSSPRREERTCDMGSCTSGWYFTEWPTQCPATCSRGTLTRRVRCFSASGNVHTACPDKDKPETEQSCRSQHCRGFWLTGPWSQCNATCGMAYQTRAVTCAQKQRDRISVVTESACSDEERPPTYMSCDLEPCEPEWYMNDWGECSATCESGQRSRDVRCLDHNQLPSSGCDRNTKPVERESCTVNRACPVADQSEVTQIPEPATVRKPEPEDPNCVDKFSQCLLVLQNRLCRYPYYTNICCKSCSMVLNT